MLIPARRLLFGQVAGDNLDLITFVQKVMSVLNQYLESVAPELRELVRELDAIIRKAAPNLDASLKWGNLTYHHTHNVCSLVSHKEYVNIQIWGGATIDDPNRLLTGTGKAMRHVRVSVCDAFNRRAVAAIVRAAAKALNEPGK